MSLRHYEPDTEPTVQPQNNQISVLGSLQYLWFGSDSLERTVQEEDTQ
jgi:hypothetical protein